MTMAEVTQQQPKPVDNTKVINRLRQVRMTGKPRSIKGLEDIAKQFDEVAQECDSSAHELAAMVMRWAAGRINRLERTLDDIHSQSSREYRE
jgi:SepF-like predicted cell division protein (DUF552 family)